LKETRIAKECEYVQEVLLRMKTEGLVVYGREETQKAISMGAVEILLVSDKKIVEFEKLMERVERLKGKVVIIGSDHEMGEQFLHLGGIAGFLRFRIDY
jgi:stalled ribosome rescue protein Dom34